MQNLNDQTLTPEQRAEIEALAAQPEAEINTAALPERKDWSGARRGLFYARSSRDDESMRSAQS